MGTYRNSPCFNCKDRRMRCHGDCLEYKKYKEELDMINQGKNKDSLLDAYKCDNRRVSN